MSTRHKFNIDEDHEKHCEYGKQPEFSQNGCRFDAGYNYIGRADKPDDTPENRVAEKKTARDRAAEKIGKLDGFRPDPKPDAIQQSLDENESARQAEEHVG